jgi:septal ring factor EnvC (AmiA/AmiB activator)
MEKEVERKRKELQDQLALLNQSEDKVKKLETTHAQLKMQMIEAQERLSEYGAKISNLERETQEVSQNIKQENKVLSGVP